jgi:hypothetical protein
LTRHNCLVFMEYDVKFLYMHTLQNDSIRLINAFLTALNIFVVIT